MVKGVHTCHSICVCKSLDVSLCVFLGVSPYAGSLGVWNLSEGFCGLLWHVSVSE